MKLEQHELSAKFSRMSPEAIEAMAEDIKQNGLQHSILLYEGKVLDGWNRYEACLKAGVNPRTTIFRGTDPAAIVISENIHRRHDLTPGQRALMVVEIRSWAKTGKPAKGAAVAPLATVATMAEEAGTGERLVQQAKVVSANGIPALKEAVKKEEIAIEKAAAVAKKPKREQAKALKEAKEKKPKLPKKPSAAKPKQDDGRVKELLAQSDEDAKRIAALEAVVKSLKQSDKDAEIEKLHKKYAQLEGRLQQCMTTQNEAKKDATYAKGMLAKVRAALKVKKDSDILEAIRNG